eukprot:4719157-Pyramimonas_sp.AAC.1
MFFAHRGKRAGAPVAEPWRVTRARKGHTKANLLDGPANREQPSSLTVSPLLTDCLLYDLTPLTLTPAVAAPVAPPPADWLQSSGSR